MFNASGQVVSRPQRLSPSGINLTCWQEQSLFPRHLLVSTSLETLTVSPQEILILSHACQKYSRFLLRSAVSRVGPSLTRPLISPDSFAADAVNGDESCGPLRGLARHDSGSQPRDQCKPRTQRIRHPRDIGRDLTTGFVVFMRISSLLLVVGCNLSLHSLRVRRQVKGRQLHCTKIMTDTFKTASTMVCSSVSKCL